MPEMGILTANKQARPARRNAAASGLAAPTGLADALFTTTQQRVLALLFGQPARSFFVTELIELTGSGSGAVQRELKRLTSSGLVTVKRVGNQKHYQANPDSPVFEELRGLVVKTVALAEPIRQALEPLADRIELALLYGSVVKGTDTTQSDIDIIFNKLGGDPSVAPSGSVKDVFLENSYGQLVFESTVTALSRRKRASWADPSAAPK